MVMLRISELAERSGVPSSTVRYYERIGLVEPVGRAANGYRVYDETSVERLAFVGRAKRLGMCLDDVATLVDAWFAGDCEPAQDQLRAFVTGRIGELRRRIADDSAFERQLERILVRLGEVRVPKRCGPDCGCDAVDVDDLGSGSGSVETVCSLSKDEVGRRLHEWRGALGEAQAVHREGPVLRASFDPSWARIAELGRLCTAETACCPFFAFSLEITASSVVLTMRGLPGADAVAVEFFELISATTTNDPGFVQPPRSMSRSGG